MKMRKGFVSNSSSTSFCIYGTTVKDELEAKLPEGLNYYYGDPNNEGAIYIGKYWSDIGDDETGRQFKESVEKALEELLGKKVECGTIDEGYFG